MCLSHIFTTVSKCLNLGLYDSTFLLQVSITTFLFFISFLTSLFLSLYFKSIKYWLGSFFRFCIQLFFFFIICIRHLPSNFCPTQNNLFSLITLTYRLFHYFFYKCFLSLHLFSYSFIHNYILKSSRLFLSNNVIYSPQDPSNSAIRGTLRNVFLASRHFTW